MNFMKLFFAIISSMFLMSSLVFAQDTTFTVTTDGNVGIGTTSPVAKLHLVNGSAGFTPSTATELAIESSGLTRIEVMSPANSAGQILFGSPTEEALVVGLGKSSTMLGALANGVPMLLFPVWSEQPYVAARCEAAGVATIVIPHVPANMEPHKIRSAVRALLKDENPVRIAVGKMRRELTEGGFDRAADLLACLAENREPIRRKD